MAGSFKEVQELQLMAMEPAHSGGKSAKVSDSGSSSKGLSSTAKRLET
jgi:hypothetical protein